MRKRRIERTDSDETESGMMIVLRIFQLPAPSIFAASTSASGICSMFCFMKKIPKLEMIDGMTSPKYVLTPCRFLTNV